MSTTIPFVMAAVGDALGSGIVSGLARPGGNVTGVLQSGTRCKAARATQGDSAGPDGRGTSVE